MRFGMQALAAMVLMAAAAQAKPTGYQAFLLSMDTPPTQEQREAEPPAVTEEEPAVVKAVPKPKPAPAKPVVGYVEYVDVLGIRERAKAKLDSGAKTSSVNAEIIKRFERDEKKYVVFRVVLDEDHEQVLEHEILREAKIKAKDGGLIERPVVELELCIAGRHVKGEVNLSERDHFIYPILIGRNMLAGNFVIDSAKTFTNKTRCDKP
jgi:hypothetical protein